MMMSKAMATLMVGMGALLLVTGTLAGVKPTGAQKCAAAKLKLVGKKAGCQLGIAANPKKGNDFTQCTTSYATAFPKVKGTCGGDRAGLGTQVDAFQSEIAAALTPNTSKCEARKIKAAGKLQMCELRADAKAVLVARTADFRKCATKFATAFTKLEAAKKEDCTTTADAAAIEADVDAFTGAVRAASSPCGTFLRMWGSSGSGDGQFERPIGLAVDSSGNVFVTDFSTRVQKFTNSGTFLTMWGGRHGGEFAFGEGVAVDRSGSVFVTDAIRVYKFTNSGTFLTTWGSEPSRGVAVDGSGNVFVADADYSEGRISRIQKFTNTGTFITTWGSTGSGDGQFNFPVGVAVDGSGNVFVGDSSNDRIQKFTNTGTFITTWGSTGSRKGHFSAPNFVAVDGSGNVFVADTGNDRIQEFTNTGTFLTLWGTDGTGDGQFRSPMGIAVDASGNVFVADQGNDRIQEFACPAITTTNTTTMSTTTSTTLACVVTSGCFCDTGDGTIHATCTGLQWEKKDGVVGNPENAADLHNVNNLYSWAGCCDGGCSIVAPNYCQPNPAAAATCMAQANGGTVGCSTCASGTCKMAPGVLTTVWDWVNQVNAASFAGHSDWRLPLEGDNNDPSTGPDELSTITVGGPDPPSCTNPCIDSIFGPTASNFYWSASAPGGPFAWGVYFVNGSSGTGVGKVVGADVRAVR